MKGKQGLAAARRREAGAQEAAAQVKRDKADQKAAYEEEIKRLRAELSDLRNDINARAADLAREEIQRVNEELEALRRERRADAARLEALAQKKDAFVFSAAHYLGMREGHAPAAAARLALTWMTGEPYVGQYTDQRMREEGLLADGWAATVLRPNRYTDRVLVGQCGAATVPLQQAHDEGHVDIHPGYRKEDWCYRPGRPLPPRAPQAREAEPLEGGQA